MHEGLLEGDSLRSPAATGEDVHKPGPQRLSGSLEGWRRTAWIIGCAAFGVQLVGLLVWSYHLWSRYDLTSDFATFYQAWNAIGTGHLNPYETTFAYNYPHYGYAFWQSHFEILMWPLAILRALGASAFSLLIVQDLAVVGTGLVAFRFGLEYLQWGWRADRRGEQMIVGGLLVILLASPWTYWVGSFDFHFQPIAVFFVVLCARDLWLGRRRAALWAALVLACGDVAASYLIGLGLAAVLSGRDTRRRGVYLIVAGVAWVLFVVAIGSGKGSTLAGSYGYLAGMTASSGVGATVLIPFKILLHPSAVARVVSARFGEIYKYIAASGTLGIFSAIGFGMALFVLTPNALNQSAVFISSIAAFQNFAAVIFMMIGAVTVTTWVVRTTRRPMIAVVLMLAATVQVAVLAAHWIPLIPQTYEKVSAPVAAELARAQARVPENSEVVVSQGVIGRFGGHREVYPFLDSFVNGQTIPVDSDSVVFVFVPRQGIELATAAQTEAAASFVQRTLHARTEMSTADVKVFAVDPAQGHNVDHTEPVKALGSWLPGSRACGHRG